MIWRNYAKGMENLLQMFYSDSEVFLNINDLSEADNFDQFLRAIVLNVRMQMEL